MPKLNLLLDENIGIFVAEQLRKQDYNVFSVLESMAGANDEKVLSLAQRQKRIVVTLDKDFGKLVHFNQRRHAGVILLRLADESPKNIYKILTLVLSQPLAKFKGRFVVGSETKIRMR